MALKLYELIKRPMVTEKTAVMAETGSYVFEVNPSATKTELKKAFEELFDGRKVVSIRTIVVPAYKKRVGRFSGTVNAGKKAIFTVVGEPIELFASA
ncbi:MAG: 50S ribosomal protein L23 [Vampirovibrionales bacterium]|nr:50S ribosomal protein L23 [Vampirovibrionales bacterium]